MRALVALLLLSGCGIPDRYLGTYEGDLQVLRVPLKEVREICGRNDANACAMLRWYGCLIVLPTEFKNGPKSKLYIHEQAHCKGWSGGHPAW